MNDTLVLDSNWIPQSFCSYQTAVKLWYEGRATIVKEDESGKMLHSPSFEMGLPRVICVKNAWVKRKRQAVPCTRSNIYLRDNGTCQYCGKHITTQEFQIEHVVPRCQGGTTIWSNVVASCLRCNRDKGGRTPEQAGMQIRRVFSHAEIDLEYKQRPYTPKSTDPRFNFKLHINKLRPEWTDWEQWLYAEKASWSYWNVELDH